MKTKYIKFYNENFGAGTHCTKSWGFASFEAGAQSKQAEIDELRKSIDSIVKSLENIKNDQLRSYSEDYDKGWRDCAIAVLNDLKGTTNEQ